VRIALVHNERAGHGTYAAADLVRLFHDAGYEVDHFARDNGGIERAIRTRPQVVVASGGDGTVAKVAIALRGSPMPLFILPTGTSNNIARAVGADGTVPMLIAQLSKAQDARLDLGRIAGDGHEKWFVEGAGVGFIGVMLRDDERTWHHIWRRIRDWLPGGGDPRTRLHHGVARYLHRAHSRYVHVVADGEDLSGEYAAVVIMNIPALGPRIVLAERANPSDQRLDLVLVRWTDREALADHIASTRATTPPIGVRSVQRVELDWPDSDTHVDDELWPRGARRRPDRVVVDVAGSVNLLLPRP
jgi:diacylglycerol kinase family enzyme